MKCTAVRGENMRCVIQRVAEASVTSNGVESGRIGQGFMVLIGVSTRDTDKDVRYMAEKVPNLRIFEDENGKMNRSLRDVGGAILAVSQFTLYGVRVLSKPRGRKRPTGSMRSLLHSGVRADYRWKPVCSARTCRCHWSMTAL